jgi:hypothetical protein
VHQESLVFVKTLKSEEYNEWLVEHTGGGQ